MQADDRVKLFDAASGKCLHTLAAKAETTGLFFSDSRVFRSTDKRLEFWNLDKLGPHQVKNN
eukprot:4543036-Pyramimonas_sp.AAC.1